MSSFSLETSTPMCTVPDFMLYYPCLEAEPGDLTASRNAYTTVEPLDETRRWAELTRRVMPLDLLEPRRRRPVRERPFRAGRSVRTLVRLNSGLVYHISIRQDLLCNNRYRTKRRKARRIAATSSVVFSGPSVMRIVERATSSLALIAFSTCEICVFLESHAAPAEDGIARQAKAQADYCVTSSRQFFICNFRERLVGVGKWWDRL